MTQACKTSQSTITFARFLTPYKIPQSQQSVGLQKTFESSRIPRQMLMNNARLHYRLLALRNSIWIDKRQGIQLSEYTAANVQEISPIELVDLVFIERQSPQLSITTKIDPRLSDWRDQNFNFLGAVTQGKFTDEMRARRSNKLYVCDTSLTLMPSVHKDKQVIISTITTMMCTGSNSQFKLSFMGQKVQKMNLVISWKRVKYETLHEPLIGVLTARIFLPESIESGL